MCCYSNCHRYVSAIMAITIFIEGAHIILDTIIDVAGPSLFLLSVGGQGGKRGESDPKTCILKFSQT